MSALRETLIEKLDGLTDEQVAALLSLVRAFEHEDEIASEYDESKDPLVAMFSGPSDLAERSEDILQQELGLRKTDERED